VLLGWIIAVIAIIAVASAAGSRFRDDFGGVGQPGQASSILAQRFPAAGDGGDVGRGQPVQVQVDPGKALQAGPQVWEWLNGPRQSVERGGRLPGGAHGAGRACLRAVPTPCEQAQPGRWHLHLR
jgi:hypothetical protein